MKKFIAGLLVGLILCGGAFAATLNAETTDIKVVINGSQSSAMPIVLNGSTYLPLKAISTVLGCYVNWNEKLRQVEVYTSEKTSRSSSNNQPIYTTPNYAAPNSPNLQGYQAEINILQNQYEKSVTAAAVRKVADMNVLREGMANQGISGSGAYKSREEQINDEYANTTEALKNELQLQIEYLKAKYGI